MKRVFINGKGEIVVREVEPPELQDRGILLKTAYSLISTGTESRGILGRRKQPRDDAVESPVGYTNSGTVLEVGPEVQGVGQGDKVGCYGSTYGLGGHAGICYIVRNLFVKLPDSVDLREAAFTGLGGIAIQAVRRAELSFGETAVVMGLGILGQLIARICDAAGYRVIATDLLPSRLKFAREAGITALNASEDVIETVKDATEGHGADAVLICVATDSAEPIAQALEMIRLSGRIVMVGVTGMDIERGAIFDKEADFVVSRAAGPGRYDPSYEGHGVDMPYPFVRWTEGRNLHEFIRLLSEKRVRVDDLISHEFPVERAADAFEQVLTRPEETLGVLLKY